MLLISLLGKTEASFYVCGPRPFMACVYQALLALSVDPADVRYECFGPRQALTQEAEAAA